MTIIYEKENKGSEKLVEGSGDPCGQNHVSDYGCHHWDSSSSDRGQLGNGSFCSAAVRSSFPADVSGRPAGIKSRGGRQVKIGINCGHTLEGAGYGAVGILRESEHTRLVGQALTKLLEDDGIWVTDCTVDAAANQQRYLEAAAERANRQALDWFISLHFNASADHKGRGVEIYTWQGRKYPEALRICANMEGLGFRSRGIKDGSGLYVIRRTRAKAMLIEVCFCDNQADADTYYRAGGAAAVARAIFQGFRTFVGGTLSGAIEGLAEPFDEFVGRVAKQDWDRRRIMLPSVVVAQAIKESSWGTSELAQKAKALFGIKKNGWPGRVYVKEAVEQQEDGSFVFVKNTEWRAYESWEQSILDHNDYIATRRTGSGDRLRYGPVIGCDSYVLACRYLQECGYATALDYGESLIRDYIKKYELQRFDT